MIAAACNCGIPQHRTKIYIVAFKSREACEDLTFPAECKLENRLFDVIDQTVKIDDLYYYHSQESLQYKMLDKAITYT